MQWSVVAIIILGVVIGAFTLWMPDQINDVPIPNGDSQGDGQIEQPSDDRQAVSGGSLDLSGQGLQKVPAYVFDMRQLAILDVSDNQLIGALQAEVRFLANLKVLDLSNNKFTGVPAEVGQLSQLEELDLSNNQLTGLPHELGNLKKLKRLDLRGNDPSEFDLNIIKEALPNATILVD